MSPTPWRLQADYLENCNCDLLCPCLFASKPTQGDCNVPIAYHIRQGHYGSIRLCGLTVVRVTIFPGPGIMASGNQKLALYIDERATQAQYDALVEIFTGKAGGPLERLQTLVTDFLGVKRVPITYTIDGALHSVFIPDIVDVVVEPAGGANPPREMVITNTRHACGPDLPVARGIRGIFRDYGFAWDNAGKNGHYKLIEWAVS
ncbi:MAG TPA: DUF1326 domain-containing protein [Candidatus Tectomicrobia bacterium]|jgi:hypothetical protein